jgi:hypothetical protein
MEQNVRVSILESSGPAKPEELIMNKSVFNGVYFFNVILNNPTCFSNKVLYKSVPIGTPIPTKPSGQKKTRDTSPNIPQFLSVGDDDVRHIEHNMLGDDLGEDGGLGDITFQPCVFLEDTLYLSQNPKHHSTYP